MGFPDSVPGFMRLFDGASFLCNVLLFFFHVAT